MKFAIGIFIIAVAMQPVAQVLEKVGIRQVGAIGGFKNLFSLPTIAAIVTNPYIISGVLLSALMLVFWLGAMSTLPVSYMYPIGSLSYVILTVLAHFILKEPIQPIHWAGITFIVVGCLLIHQTNG